MVRSWAGRLSRRPGDATAQAAQVAQDGAVTAFLDLDGRQSYVADAIAAVSEVAGPGESAGAGVAMTRAWAPVAQACLQATAEYLAVSDRLALATPDGRPTGSDPVAAQSAFTSVHRDLADAAAKVDAFYRTHATELERARSARAATPRIAAQAREAAGVAEQALARAEEQQYAYPSVQDAAGRLIAGLDRLAAAERTGQVGAIRAAAAAVQAAAGQVQEQVTAAAGLLPTVRAASSSVRTRIEAVQGRVDDLPAVRSALLREFTATSSRDLDGVDGRARQALEAARKAWTRAGQALDTGRPEEASRELAEARSQLGITEGHHHELTERLRMLREARTDPEASAKKTRFRLRDAQLLVVDRGLIKEWGSVLDAQVARIDRAVAGLTGTHPDYWAYLQALSSVESFVKGVVDRVRTAAH